MQYLQSLYDHPHPHFDNPPLDQTTTDDVHATGLEVFIKMAEVCTYQANYQKALEMLDQVLVVHSSHEIALTFKGFINCILGQRDESFTYFNRVLFHNPLNYSAFAHRGYLFIMEDSFKAAKQDLERSLQICKENAYANAYLGELAYREQRTFKALEHFNLSLCQETSYIGLVGRGKCFLKLNLVKNAAYDFETAVDLFPNFQEAESYLELIKNQIGSTTIKQCLALKKEAIDLELRKILTNMDKKALSCTKMGQKVLEIEAKLKTDEFRENLWLEKGFLELLLEKYDHALEDLNKALVLNPFNDQAYAHRGRIFYLYNLKLAAQNDWEASLSLEPFNSYVFAYEGEAALDAHQLYKAKNYFDQSLSSLETEIGYFGRGKVNLRLGFVQEAVSDFSHSTALNPSYQLPQSYLELIKHIYHGEEA